LKVRKGEIVMRNPQRNDVYVNSEGFKVVVNNVLSPNPSGVQTLEYKFIGSPELYFVPVQEFVEQFEFVETFSSFDIYIEERNKLLQIKEEEEAKAALLRKQAKEEAATAIKR
jgi:predicted Zn-dependent protease